MARDRLRWMLALAVCVSAPGAPAQQAASTVSRSPADTAAVRAGREYLREARARQLVPGVQVAVMVAILWNGDFGDFAAGRVAEPFLARKDGRL